MCDILGLIFGWALCFYERRNMLEEDIVEFINRRRKQILVHSVMYYKMDESIIPDQKWDRWARELCEMQRMYPELAEKCVYPNEFRNFDATTGFDLPLDDRWANGKAMWLLIYKRYKEV